jgi:hypothetical protein
VPADGFEGTEQIQQLVIARAISACASSTAASGRHRVAQLVALLTGACAVLDP